MTILRHDDEAVRTLTLHRPDALTPALLFEFGAFAEAAEDTSVRVVVLTGAGVDLKA